MRRQLLATVLGAFVAASQLHAQGSIFLTGHDPDFHAQLGPDGTGARNINRAAIGFVQNPAYNPFFFSGVNKFLFVESKSPATPGNTNGVYGIVASGYANGVDFDHHDYSSLNGALNQLGVGYSAIVVASDCGGMLTDAELSILDSRSSDIINFLNAGGGLYAMSEGNSCWGNTPTAKHFGFLPFVVTSTAFNETEAGNYVTPFGAALGITNDDVNGNFSHNVFASTSGMEVVDYDSNGEILTLAVHSAHVSEGGIDVAPEPATVLLLASGLAILGAGVRRRRS